MRVTLAALQKMVQDGSRIAMLNITGTNIVLLDALHKLVVGHSVFGDLGTPTCRRTTKRAESSSVDYRADVPGRM